MTHDDRVYHHMYETLEGIAEQSERIASLEELVLELRAFMRISCRRDCGEWVKISSGVGTCGHGFCKRLNKLDERMRALGIETEES